MPKREIEIFKIDLLKVDEANLEIEFKVECSKGTYIRSLCEDIAKKLHTVGHMKSLIRTNAGDFNLEEAISLEELETNKDNEEWVNSHSLSVEKVLKNHFQKLELKENHLTLFLNGVKLTYNVPDGVYNIYCNNEYLGTGIENNSLLKRDIIISET